jgi:hypothetical protein
LDLSFDRIFSDLNYFSKVRIGRVLLAQFNPSGNRGKQMKTDENIVARRNTIVTVGNRGKDLLTTCAQYDYRRHNMAWLLNRAEKEPYVIRLYSNLKEQNPQLYTRISEVYDPFYDHQLYTSLQSFYINTCKTKLVIE